MKSTAEYVIEQFEHSKLHVEDIVHKMYKYAKLMNRAPQLGDFVPVKDGKPMIDPEELKGVRNDSMVSAIEQKNYEQDYKEALDRCIFEGFEVVANTGMLVRLSNGDFSIDFMDCECKYDRIEQLPKNRNLAF
jgi:hypothetical protein